MRRKSRGWGWVSFVLIVSVLFLNACGGGKPATTIGPPATVTLTVAGQTAASFNAGEVFQLTVTVLDAQGRNVLTQTPTFSSSNPRIQVANNASLCAGTWLDGSGQPSLSTPIVCRPPGATNQPSDPPLDANGLQASITATAGGITSAPITVFVHLQITSIDIQAVPSPAPACVAQAATVQYRAFARNNGTDITSSVGQINWQVLNGQVASVSPLITPAAASGGGTDPVTVTAKLPGTTKIVATANTLTTVQGLPVDFTECPVAKITVTAPDTTLSGANATVQLTAVAVDTTGAEVTAPPANFTAPTLTWSSNPAGVATVNASGLVTGQAPGTAGVVVGCVPGSCNIGLQPVYSDVLPITVSGSSSTTVYAASKDGSTLIPITTSNNTAGTAITLPNNQKPNSLVFSPTGARAFLGSDGGMIVIDATNNTLAANVTAAPGRVLAVSPDSNRVLVSDVSARLLRIFDGTNNTVTNLPLTNASAASFTPDGSKAYIAAGDKLAILQGTALSTLTAPSSAADIAALANGNAAYLANAAVSQVLTCNNSISAGPGGAPTFVRSLPTGKQVLGVSNSSIDAFDVTVTPAAGSSASACPTVTPGPLVPHSISSAAPDQLLVSPDSTKAFVVSRARSGSVIAYDVGADANSGSTSTIALSGGTAATTTGGITPDSKFLYVGGTDNKVHVIDIAAGTDTAQIPATGDLGFTPDFVAVRPH